MPSTKEPNNHHDFSLLSSLRRNSDLNDAGESITPRLSNSDANMSRKVQNRKDHRDLNFSRFE